MSQSKTRENMPDVTRKKKIWIAVIGALLAVALTVGLVFALLPSSPEVLRYQNAVLRENEYAYWVACYKYHYLVSTRGVEDTAEAWAKPTADGRSYDAVFKEAIDNDIALRFVAAALFDASDAVLSETELWAVENAASDIFTYSYGEDVAAALSANYGISAKEMKRIALYEVKYGAYRSYLFGSDFNGVYSAEYATALDAFYKEHYARYNMIYLSDEKSADAQREISLYLDVGMSEESFTKFEQEFSEMPVTKNYPNGIYIYDGKDYSDAFSKEMLAAIEEANEVGKVATVRDKDDKGTYYVMRYALDEAPYRSTNENVQKSLSDLAENAAAYLYPRVLAEEIAKAQWKTEYTNRYTMAYVTRESKYNIVRLVK